MAIFGLGNKKRTNTSYSDGYQSAADTFSASRHDLTVGDYANGVPNIRLSSAFNSFIKQIPMMLVLFAIGAILAFYATKDLKRKYKADGTLMVQLGDEYVYQPVGVEGGQNALQLTPDSIILTEVGIIKNSSVIDRVIGRLTDNSSESVRFDKKAHDDIRSAISRNNEAERVEAIMERRKRVEKAFNVFPNPKSSIINLSYEHSDPAISVKAANAFIDEYIEFRKQVFINGTSDVISQRRAATEEQLNANERAIASFLKRNNISDFGSEQKGSRDRTEALKTELNTVRASISETEGSLAIVEDQLRNTPETINIYVDDRASQRVAQAELELAQLLAKYLPTSDPVREKRTEIEQLKSVQASANGAPAGGRRVGPNTVYQTLTTTRNGLQATADSLREKEFTLQRQLDSADSKLRRLGNLGPEYQNLLRERTTLAARLSTYNAREQEALINQEQAEASSENVKIISRPSFATKGRNMRMLGFLIACVFWGFTLVMIALARVFLDPRNFAPTSGVTSTINRVQATSQSSPIPEPVMPSRVPAYAQSHEPVPYTGDSQYGAEQNYGGGGQGYADPYQGQNAYNNSASAYSGNNYDPSYQGNNAQMSNSMGGGSYDTPSAGYHPGSSAALDMYPNPYAPVFTNPSQQSADLQNKDEGGMNVLGTVPPQKPS